jgi:hypothetical protein
LFGIVCIIICPLEKSRKAKERKKGWKEIISVLHCVNIVLGIYFPLSISPGTDAVGGEGVLA